MRAIQCSAIHHSTTQHVQYSIAHHSTVQYSIVQYSSVQYSTVQYSTVQHSTAQYSTVQYSTVQYGTVRYSTVQHSTYSTVSNTAQCNSQYNTSSLTLTGERSISEELQLQLPPHVRQGGQQEGLHTLLLHENHHGGRTRDRSVSWLSVQVRACTDRSVTMMTEIEHMLSLSLHFSLSISISVSFSLTISHSPSLTHTNRHQGDNQLTSLLGSLKIGGSEVK